MHLILPTTEYWPTTATYQEQVARAARLCYASEKGRRTDEDMCKFLQEKGHLSMFRHGSAYFIALQSDFPDGAPWLWTYLTASPYAGFRYTKHKSLGNKKDRLCFVSTNMQFLLENSWIYEMLRPYEVSVKEFASRAITEHFYPALALIRYTVCVTTQISTSRELNRTSPNNIAEQSTRYVNFGKRGGITICLPHWYNSAPWYLRLAARLAWKTGDLVYNSLLRLGLPPQDARTALPLDTATRVAYTYNVIEWRHILQLRLLGTTGKPHPNALISAQQIHDAILPAMRTLGGEKSKLV